MNDVVLRLTVEQLAIVDQALSAMAYGRVAILIANINGQIAAQIPPDTEKVETVE